MLSPALPERATALLLKGLESGTPAQAASNNAYPIFLTKIFVKGFCVQLFMIRYVVGMCGYPILALYGVSVHTPYIPYVLDALPH